jgi:hypothetical protein
MAKYVVDKTESTTYVDRTNAVVNGFSVTFTLSQYDETYTIQVPALNASLIEAEVKRISDERDKLAKLGA